MGRLTPYLGIPVQERPEAFLYANFASAMDILDAAVSAKSADISGLQNNLSTQSNILQQTISSIADLSNELTAYISKSDFFLDKTQWVAGEEYSFGGLYFQRFDGVITADEGIRTTIALYGDYELGEDYRLVDVSGWWSSGSVINYVGDPFSGNESCVYVGEEEHQLVFTSTAPNDQRTNSPYSLFVAYYKV